MRRSTTLDTPFDLVIFDFDGTLADSAEWFGSVINSVARRYRFREVTRSELEQMRGLGIGEVMRGVGLPRWKVPFVARHIRKLMARDIMQIRVFPGVDELLRDLHGAGLTLAVVSSNAEANIRRVLGVETSALVGRYACGASLNGKTAKFRSVMKLAQVQAAAVIAIGDEVRDIKAAAAVGIASGAVSWGYATREALQAARPTILFDSVNEIRERLLGQAERKQPLAVAV